MSAELMSFCRHHSMFGSVRSKGPAGMLVDKVPFKTRPMNERNGSRKATMEGNTTDRGTLCNNTISEGVTFVGQDVVVTYNVSLKLQLSASVWKLSVVLCRARLS